MSYFLPSKHPLPYISVISPLPSLISTPPDSSYQIYLSNSVSACSTTCMPLLVFVLGSPTEKMHVVLDIHKTK